MGTAHTKLSLEPAGALKRELKPFDTGWVLSRDNVFLTKVALALVVLGSVIPRVNHIGKSVWTAEAWVANSVLAGSLMRMFHYDAWLQTTPPLFLVLVREAVHFMGLSVFSLRVVPLSLGVLSVALTAWLSWRVLRPGFAVLCTMLVALSPPAVVFSKEVKHYTGDVFATCLLLLALWSYLEKPDRGRFLWLGLAFTVALFLSYPAVCFIPLAVCTLALVQPQGSPDTGSWAKFMRASILALWAGAICGINYFLFIKPNSSPLLTDYWRGGFPPFGNVKELLHFYLETFFGMGIYFYLPTGTKDFFRDVLSSGGHVPLVLAVLGALGTVVIALTSLKSNRRLLAGLIFCVSPVLTLAGLNVLHLYPVNSRRLTLFLLPCVALGTGVLLQSAWDTLASRYWLKDTGRLEIPLLCACVIGIFAVALHSNQWSNYWFEDEDTQARFSA